MNNHTETQAIVNNVVTSMRDELYLETVENFKLEPTTAYEFALNGGWDSPDSFLELDEDNGIVDELAALQDHGY
jgi:hypothetical protein